MQQAREFYVICPKSEFLSTVDKLLGREYFAVGWRGCLVPWRMLSCITHLNTQDAKVRPLQP